MAQKKNESAQLADFQFAGASAGPGRPARGARSRGFDLRRFDPAAKPFSLGDKATDKIAVAALATELDTLQDMFYADRRFKLLVVLQGTDTAGKDGTIRGVFGQTSALGVHTVALEGARPRRSARTTTSGASTSRCRGSASS